MTLALTLLAAYLLGSIPFSFLVARRFGVEDVRKVGSGNVGATNVMRSAGKPAGILAFGLDFAKGAAAALLGRYVDPGGATPALAAATAVFGHMFPVWLSFRGGKGVATGAGAFLPLAPEATSAALVAFAATLGAARYVSLASIAGAVTLAVLAFAWAAPPAVARAAAGMALLIIWKHRANLERIAKGTESRLGVRK